MNRQKIKVLALHIGRAEVFCYHNFHNNTVSVIVITTLFNNICNGSFRERAEIFTFCVENMRLFSIVC